MSVPEQYTGSSCRWGIWKADETVGGLFALFPHKERYEADICGFTVNSRKLERLVVRVLLYKMLGEEKETGYRSSGKPYLADGSASISISHTKGYVIVLPSGPEKEVGIDVECYGERVRKVARKSVREDESVSWHKGTETWSLLLRWSAKETMSKYMNISDVDFRKHLHILPFTIEEQGAFPAAEHRTAEKRNFRIHCYLLPDFVLMLSL